MRVTVAINGTFRYPDYIRHYHAAGVLGAFHFAHRATRTAAALGVPTDRLHNIWPKHYAMAALFRAAPARVAPGLMDLACEGWQAAVLRRWRPSDTLETVIGGVADHVIARAQRDGMRVLGHPVTTHFATLRDLVDRARNDLGLPPEPRRPADEARRQGEITGCDALLTDSAFVARSFVANGVAPQRITVVRPAFDGARFRPRDPGDRDRRRFTVVCVGTVTPRKAQHLILRAWKALGLRDARLILVGPKGRDAVAVLRGFEGTYEHIAYLPHDALRALLVQASCFVLASAEDGFAQAPLEAMACGVPVILSDTVGAAELVTPGVNGFVVPSFDAAAIAAALDHLHRDPDLADQMGQAAAASVHQAGSWAPYVADVVALHRRLLAAPCEERVAA